MSGIVNLLYCAAWGPATLFTFTVCGVFMTIKTRFIQFTSAKSWLGTLFPHRDKNKIGDFTPFQALTSALAACLGTGNIVGVAQALNAGGAGAVFWMWLEGVLCMAVSFAENALGVKYRIPGKNGRFVGGGMTYISDGLGLKRLSRLFGFLLACSSLCMGCMTQANSAVNALGELNVPKKPCAVIFAVLIYFIVSGGVERLGKFTEKLIPPAALLFTAGLLAVVIKNPAAFPVTVRSIAAGAFNPLSFRRAARIGISRAVFSNEAGLGTAPVIHSAAPSAQPVSQGFFAMAGVFTDTVFMATLTAVAMLTAGTDSSGSYSCSHTLGTVFGTAGRFFVSAALFVFAFSTVAACSCHFRAGLSFTFGVNSERSIAAFYAFFALVGALSEPSAVWQTADIINALLAFPNLFSVFLLSGEVKVMLSAADTRDKSR